VAFRLLAAEGISADVASGGELYFALRGGIPAERCYFHGNNKTEAELRYAVGEGIGHVVADSFDELDRLERIAPGQRILLRVTPGIEPDTPEKIQTGQVDSKFRFEIDDYVEALLARAPEGVTVLCEPGRSLVGNAGVTLYTVGTVKEVPGVRTYVAVDGGMSDNPRPMLYGSRYEAELADRFGGSTK